MQHKVLNKWMGLMLISFVVSGCISTTNKKEPLSDKKNAALNLQLGVRYLEMNMLKTAKEKLENAVDLDSNNVEIRNALGALYQRLGQHDLAKKQYQIGIGFNSDNVSIRNNYGRFLCDRGEYQAGVDLLKQALSLPLNNRRWFAYNHIGQCELMKGDEVTAEGNFRQALIENSQYAPALAELQKISYRAGKYMSARAFLERYLAVSKHTAESLWYAVQTERALGNKTLADGYREKLFNRFPASKEARQLKTAIR